MSSLYVGRERELGLLATALRDALQGQPGVVLLAGEPGVGKTRTIEELARRAAVQGIPVLWGRCHEAEDVPAYWPWIQVVRELVRRCGDAPGLDRQALASLVPGVFPEHDDPDPPPEAHEPDPQHARFRLFDAVAQLLREAGRAGPLLILLDDLHWADESTLRLTEFVARDLRDQRLLVCGTYRELEVRRSRALADHLGRLARSATRIPLRGLDSEATAELINTLAGEKPSGDLARALHERTDGNPFFLGEIVRLLQAQGSLEHATADTLHVPDEVRAAIRGRIAPLDVDTRDLLSVASVIGREFDADLLGRVLGSEVLGSLDAASDAGTIEWQPGAPNRFRFVHALVRETLYADLPTSDRVRLHRKVGEAIEERTPNPGPELDSLAYHFFRAAGAGEMRRALDYSRRAARRALELLAYEEAAAHLQRAIQVLDLGGGSPALRVELLLEYGDALLRAGQLVRSQPVFAEAAALARREGLVDELARAALGHAADGEDGIASDAQRIELLEEALSALEGRPGSLRVRVLARLAEALYFSSRQGEAVTLATDALDLARALGDPGAVVSALDAYHWTIWNPDNAQLRLAASDELIETARRTGNRTLVARGVSARVENLLELGEVQEADASIAAYDALGRELRLRLLGWYATLCRSLRATMNGDLELAELYAAQAQGVGQEVKPSLADQFHGIQAIALAALRGEIEEQVPLLRRMASDSPVVHVRAGVSRFLLDAGHEPEARAFLEETAALGFDAIRRDVNWPFTIACLAYLSARFRTPEHSAPLYELLSCFDGRQIVLGLKVAWFGPSARYLGLLARDLGRHGDAERHLRDALEQVERMGARPMLAEIQCDLAELYLDADRPESAGAEAAALLDAAGRAARELGLGALTRRVEGVQKQSPAAAAPGPERAERGERRASLRREGDFWTLGFEGRSLRLRHARGLQHLARLLARPGEEIHVLDLAGGLRGAATQDASAPDSGDAGEMLDPQARDEYRRRLEGLRAELEEAESYNDLNRAEQARSEIDFLSAELSRAVGLGGRARRASNDAERARINVRRTLGLALRKIRDEDPALGRLLERSVRTGVFCCYEPDPLHPIQWELEQGADS